MYGNFDRVTVNSGLSGAITTVLLFTFSFIFPSVEIPGEVGAALAVIVSGITGYFTKAGNGQPNGNSNSSLNGEG